MSRFADWLKKNHRDFYDQITSTVNYLSNPANRDRMGIGAGTPQGNWYDTVFLPLFSAYLALWVLWNDEVNRTPGITDDFEDAEKAVQPEYRQLYTAFFKTNPLVTNHDLLAMGFPERGSGGNHPAPVATDFPDCDVDTPSPGRLVFHIFEKGKKHKKGKPAGQHGAEVLWAIRDTPTTEWSDLVHSSFDTNSPLTLTFEGHDRGKTVYYALRWENTRGEKGPFSPIQSAIIP